MDFYKLNERIVGIISDSLLLQKLSKEVEPTQLLDSRDRYYLVQCQVRGKREKCVFLRYDKWMFYLKGLRELPPALDRRDYNVENRIIHPAKENEREEINRKANKNLDKTLAKEKTRKRPFKFKLFKAPSRERPRKRPGT